MTLVRPIVWLLVLCAACGGAPSTSTTSGSSHDAAWTELRVSWDFGPCPDDGRSCHQDLVVHADGGFITTETANSPASGGAGEPARRFAALSPREISDVHKIVDAPGFLDRVGSFGCSPEYDATIRIEVVGPWGVKKDDVGGCVHSSDTRPSAVRTLIELLLPHRFASHDAKPTRGPLPGIEGDTCSATVGCANGLACVIAPCVVAPCVNGSCHKSGK